MKDGWSQLESLLQWFTHLSAVCLWIMQESSVSLFTTLDKLEKERQRERFVVIVALIAGLITATVNHHLSLLFWNCAQGGKWLPWQQTRCYLLCSFFLCPIHSDFKPCMHYPHYPHTPELHKIWICMNSLLILSLAPSPGIVFVRLGLLPSVVMLPFNIQLHHEPPGFLLPVAAWDSGLCHYDSPRHGRES